MQTDTRLAVLNNIRVASPCNMRWDDMDPAPGTAADRVRHCRDCDLNVFNFASMRADEIVDLIERTEGRLCGVLHRRADGTLITRDCPRGMERLRRAAWRARAAGVALALLVPAIISWAATNGRSTRLGDAEAFRRLSEAISPSPPPTRGSVLMGDVALPGRIATTPLGTQGSAQ